MAFSETLAAHDSATADSSEVDEHEADGDGRRRGAVEPPDQGGGDEHDRGQPGRALEHVERELAARPGGASAAALRVLRVLVVALIAAAPAA